MALAMSEGSGKVGSACTLMIFLRSRWPACTLARSGGVITYVGPTYVMTPPLRARVQSGQRDLNKIMAVHALDRLPEPADIANGIAFLCSDQARSITGILLPIDAGWLAAVSYRTYAGGMPWKE